VAEAVNAVWQAVSQQSTTTTSTSAGSQRAFYLHNGYTLDESAPTGATPSVLDLTNTKPTPPYVWKTAAFSTGGIFPAGLWSANVWMNVSGAHTQYLIRLGIVNQSGTFNEANHSYTRPVNSTSPAPYQVTILADTLSVGIGEYLAIGLERRWESTGQYSPSAFIFFDSSSAPSSLSSPGMTPTTTTTTLPQTTTTSQQLTTTTMSTTWSATTTQQVTTSTTQAQTTTTSTQQQTTTTTTQQYTATWTSQQYTTATTQTGTVQTFGMGFAFAVIGIGAGAAALGVGVAMAASGPLGSGLYTYGGYYYCRKHNVPVWWVQGRLWCPVEGRFLKRNS